MNQFNMETPAIMQSRDSIFYDSDDDIQQIDIEDDPYGSECELEPQAAVQQTEYSNSPAILDHAYNHELEEIDQRMESDSEDSEWNYYDYGPCTSAPRSKKVKQQKRQVAQQTKKRSSERTGNKSKGIDHNNLLDDESREMRKWRKLNPFMIDEEPESRRAKPQKRKTVDGIVQYVHPLPQVTSPPSQNEISTHANDGQEVSDSDEMIGLPLHELTNARRCQICNEVTRDQLHEKYACKSCRRFLVEHNNGTMVAESRCENGQKCTKARIQSCGDCRMRKFAELGIIDIRMNRLANMNSQERAKYNQLIISDFQTLIAHGDSGKSPNSTATTIFISKESRNESHAKLNAGNGNLPADNLALRASSHQDNEHELSLLKHPVASDPVTSTKRSNQQQNNQRQNSSIEKRFDSQTLPSMQQPQIFGDLEPMQFHPETGYGNLSTIEPGLGTLSHLNHGYQGNISQNPGLLGANIWPSESYDAFFSTYSETCNPPLTAATQKEANMSETESSNQPISSTMAVKELQQHGIVQTSTTTQICQICKRGGVPSRAKKRLCQLCKWKWLKDKKNPQELTRSTCKRDPDCICRRCRTRMYVELGWVTEQVSLTASSVVHKSPGAKSNTTTLNFKNGGDSNAFRIDTSASVFSTTTTHGNNPVQSSTDCMTRNLLTVESGDGHCPENGTQTGLSQSRVAAVSEFFRRQSREQSAHTSMTGNSDPTNSMQLSAETGINSGPVAPFTQPPLAIATRQFPGIPVGSVYERLPAHNIGLNVSLRAGNGHQDRFSRHKEIVGNPASFGLDHGETRRNVSIPQETADEQQPAEEASEEPTNQSMQKPSHTAPSQSMKALSGSGYPSGQRNQKQIGHRTQFKQLSSKNQKCLICDIATTPDEEGNHLCRICKGHYIDFCFRNEEPDRGQQHSPRVQHIGIERRDCDICKYSRYVELGWVRERPSAIQQKDRMTDVRVALTASTLQQLEQLTSSSNSLDDDRMESRGDTQTETSRTTTPSHESFEAQPVGILGAEVKRERRGGVIAEIGALARSSHPRSQRNLATPIITLQSNLQSKLLIRDNSIFNFEIKNNSCSRKMFYIEKGTNGRLEFFTVKGVINSQSTTPIQVQSRIEGVPPIRDLVTVFYKDYQDGSELSADAIKEHAESVVMEFGYTNGEVEISAIEVPIKLKEYTEIRIINKSEKRKVYKIENNTEGRLFTLASMGTIEKNDYVKIGVASEREDIGPPTDSISILYKDVTQMTFGNDILDNNGWKITEYIKYLHTVK